MLDVFHKLPVSHDLDDGKVRSRDVVVDTQVKFSTLLLEPQVHDGLARCGYIYLSPIQQNALPLTLTGSSIIAHAKSGTGKTLIFVLPILNDFVKRKPSGLQCLVLAPTREIAKQIYDVFRNVSSFIEGFQVEYFIGGTPVDMDVIKCKDCHVAIGAPGRIKHLIDMGYLSTTSLQLLVLDEVDALFDHKEYAIENIISLLPSPKQLIVCTATFSPKVGELVKSVVPNVKYISADKLEIEEIGNTSNMLVAIKQYVAPVTETPSMRAMKKREKLVEILQNFSFEQCFIFVNYMTLVRSICNHLNNQNFSALWICGDQNQSTRINTINKLKLNHCKILVTTDLAARGIDVHKVNLVINLGIPCPPEIYIHRMGRAGRYGSEGAVITILGEEEFPTFAKMIGVISTDPVDLHVLPERLETGLTNSKVIRCLPVERSISESEFTFKRHVKDSQEKTAAGVQNNKKAKKKKPKNPKNFASRNGSVGDGTAGAAVIDEASLSSMIPQIEEFSQSLAELVDGQLKPDEESLKRLFEAEDGRSSFAFVQNPSTNLLTYALHVKRKNELVDEQIMPCHVEEFASLTNSQKLFARHSTGLSNLVGEVCGKIWRPKYPRGSVSERSVDSEQSESCSQVSSSSTLSQRLLDALTNGDEKVAEKPTNAWPKRFSGACNLAEEFLCVMTNWDESSSSELQSGDGISGRCAIEKDRISDLIACNGERNTRRTEDFKPSKPVPYHAKSAVKNNWRQPSEDFSNQFLNTLYPPVDISSQNSFKIELPSPGKLNLPNHQSSEHKPRENTKKSNRVHDKSDLSDQLLNAFQNSVSLEPGQNKSEQLQVSSNRPSKKNFSSHQSPEQLPDIKNERNQPNPSNNKFDLSSQFINAFQNSEACTGQNTRNSGPSNQPSESKKPLREHTNKRTQPNRVDGKFNLSDQFFDAFRSSVTSSSSKAAEESNHSSEKLSNHHSEKEMRNTNEKPRQPNRIGAKFDLSDQFSNTFHSSDTPSSSEITEAPNQLSGNVKLSNHHSDKEIPNEKARQPNRVGGEVGLADQFLDAFRSSDTSRSSKLAEAPNQSSVELSKHDSEIQNANETTVCFLKENLLKTRQSNRSRTAIADQFLNAVQQSPAADTRTQSMPEKQKVSPYQLPRKPNQPNHFIEDEKRPLESTDKKSTASTSSLYNQFSNPLADSNIETSTRSASQQPRRSPNDLSRNQNHYHSGFTCNLPYMKNDDGVSNQISNDFNLADQFSKIVDDSVRRADFKNTFKGRRTSPNGFSSNFNHSNRAQPQNWRNERVTPQHSDNRCQRSLSDQFLNSATDAAGFDSERRTNSCGTNLNVGGRSKESKVSNGVWYPEFGDKKYIQDAAILEKVAENAPKSTNENSSPFDPFFYTFGRTDSNKERPEMTSSVSSLFDRFASVQSDKKPVGLQRAASDLSNIECEPKSDTIPVLKENDTPPDLGIKADLVPEIKNLFLAASTKQNMSSSPKNCSSLSDEANEESSPSVSNSKKPIRALTGDYSPWASEIWKNTVRTAKPQNELRKPEPSSNAIDEIRGNQLGAVPSSKQSSRSVPQAENARPSASNVPVSAAATSAAASHSRAATTTLPPGPTAAMLPSLRSFVGAQQEQHIWQHHFGFIGRFVASKGKGYQRR